MRKSKINWFKLIISIAICQMAGVVGSLATMPSIGTWYATLAKPWWTPPNWLFGPVWITLFTLMGISLYLVWFEAGRKKELPFFPLQLGLNIMWSYMFFGLHRPDAAFKVIIFLWLAILGNIYVFYKVDKRAGYLLVPYIVWVTIAAALNYSVWMLNLV